VQTLLKEIFVFVYIVDIPGHTDIAGNDIADDKVRELAKCIFAGKVVVPESLSITLALKIASHISHKSWQHKWDEESTRRHTYDLIPVVGTKVCYPEVRGIGVSYCRMLLYDTMLTSTILEPLLSPMYECGAAKDTVDHFLFRCPKYSHSRGALLTLNWPTG